jgi:protein TonB
MPAASEVGPRERAAALAAVALVQLGLGLILLNGLRVQLTEPVQAVQRLIDVTLPRTPPPVPKPTPREAKKQSTPAPRADPKPLGGSPGPQPTHAAPAVAPLVAIRPSAPPSGGGSGTGPALGAGSAGGAGGQGYGGGGGTDLELISGEILPSDYPKHLGNAGIGGRVSVTFTVETNGRVTNCRITRSSGIPELDALTCRLMEQRFRFRPSTDRYGRPIRDEVDWDQDWIAPRD